MIPTRRIVLALMTALAAQLLVPGAAAGATTACAADIQPHPDDCDRSGAGACIMTCGIICATLIPDGPGQAVVQDVRSTPFWLTVRSSLAHSFGPEPPPPRIG